MIKKTNKKLEKIFAGHLQCNKTQDIVDYVRYKHLIAYNYWKQTGNGAGVVFAYGDVLGKFDALERRKEAERIVKIIKKLSSYIGSHWVLMWCSTTDE